MNGRRGRFQAVAVAFVFIGLIGILSCCWHYPFAGNPAAWSIGGTDGIWWYCQLVFDRLQTIGIHFTICCRHKHIIWNGMWNVTSLHVFQHSGNSTAFSHLAILAIVGAQVSLLLQHSHTHVPYEGGGVRRLSICWWTLLRLLSASMPAGWQTRLTLKIKSCNKRR